MFVNRRNFCHRTLKIKNLNFFDIKFQKKFFVSSLNLKGLEKKFFLFWNKVILFYWLMKCVHRHIFFFKVLFSRDKQDFLFFLVNCPLQTMRFLISALEWELCDGLPHGNPRNHTTLIENNIFCFFLHKTSVTCFKLLTFCF